MPELKPNSQPTKELAIFQRFVVQSHYIKQLNLWLDELAWENEKKETIIEMRENEIQALKAELELLSAQKERTEIQFKEYVHKVKESRKGVSREQKEIEVGLRREIDSLKMRLKTSHRLNELLVKQGKAR
ncbi:MAG TPA: hypothetical protein VL728_19400 [Cyclobacteriaceae bacterium]|jgi:hypothetical protein|nr:hypothetical protein [Cyclobacteriaceae bacterium]